MAGQLLVAALLAFVDAHGDHCHTHRKAGKGIIHTPNPVNNNSLVAMTNDTHVRVRWTNPVGVWGKSQDWIGMYPADHDLRLFTSPIEFIFARSATPGATSESFPPVNGEVAFPRSNWRTDVVFYYITGTAMYPVIGAKSNVVVEARPYHPMHRRLALRDGETHVTWTQRGRDGEHNGTARLWGPDGYREVHAWLEDNYARTDMCDSDFSPAGREGWFEPGQQLTASLGALRPNTAYTYQVGRGAEWSGKTAFTTGPAAGGRVRLAVFGDMGQRVDWHEQRVLEHDFGNQTGQPGSYPTLQTLEALQDAGRIDGVVHFGDIAYATGYLSEWSTFLSMIEPVARRTLWQASIGNHEMGWRGSRPELNTSTDSGGECGVPFRAHFPLSVETTRGPDGEKLAIGARDAWYGFEYGSATFLMLNSEEEYGPGSRQMAWLRGALKEVNRQRTPWLVVTIHRPVLVTSIYDGDLWMMAELQRDLVPVLEDAGVDLVLSGHHHTYQRMCRFYRGRCVGASNSTDGKGVPSFVMGMAGYPLQKKDQLPAEPFVELTNQDDYGVGVLDFHNATHLEVTFVANAGVTRDHVWITRVAEPAVFVV